MVWLVARCKLRYRLFNLGRGRAPTPHKESQEETMTGTAKKKNRGPKPLAPEDKREHVVMARLTSEELARLDELREKARIQRGPYIRAAALDRLPQTIPTPNREAWAKLAGPAANLNQIARHLNEMSQRGEGCITTEVGAQLAAQLTECRRLITLLRNDLIGVRSEADDES